MNKEAEKNRWSRGLQELLGCSVDPQLYDLLVHQWIPNTSQGGYERSLPSAMGEGGDLGNGQMNARGVYSFLRRYRTNDLGPSSILVVAKRNRHKSHVVDRISLSYPRSPYFDTSCHFRHADKDIHSFSLHAVTVDVVLNSSDYCGKCKNAVKSSIDWNHPILSLLARFQIQASLSKDGRVQTNADELESLLKELMRRNL